MKTTPLLRTVATASLLTVNAVSAAEPPNIASVSLTESRNVRIEGTVPQNAHFRLQASRDLETWSTLLTERSADGSIDVVDDSASTTAMYYRVNLPADSSPLTGDHLATDQGDVVFHPIDHASFVMSWNGLTIFADPVGNSRIYNGFPDADIILITHAHGDHFSTSTLAAITTDTTTILVPQIVWNGMSQTLRDRTTIIANEETQIIGDVSVEAVPAYNLTPDRLNFHPRGVGNSYVITLGGRRIFISGDTEDVPEMRALEDIDIAFVCMNLPFTMTVDQAADAVIEFQPEIVYPYHSRDSDVNRFQQLVEEATDVKVRLRDWY